ncbi:3-hydroxybutyryl-CoA dehydrogenase [Chloracidobacterium aggregatum]|uniref:3-hydroxybutyryl-CoA dehydrogenase n=1 Tax=Chloracidobacterium sp. N TaxID=2821540 RepID=A0ABX8AZL2_9BACT|nr:3-hydroxybutyryl-CoA dehydrogenase [Chloracidobacterium aggregatum]QUV85572.1 3-hydroxybutyryl-CoA dehydrogenase [Chloracidobacterium sp. 2]QUV88025.1 3-hydroxybutyryl-CoA dehydrogenase [Chloracidobacterium sp. S]QUV90946.1 3-hydroxybutyryl-CoA dehydrogenase [Chloracidobacterium sp. A]QUV94135.1 3-hydroxybutyryl-CoA dehydrogenase [Chloracidobacterium sp. N]QUV97333.1 3-hydroxybutyryl-CoA dehydrogenase [Chloracidobacterium sp. E]
MGTFAVIGAGTMGSGIAQVAARAGFQVVLRDIAPEYLDRGLAAIRSSLERDVKKERLTVARQEEILARIRPTTELAEVAGAEIVVEAIIENFDAKASLFRELDALTPPETVLATNTSSISITKIAATTKRPAQVIGMHFMNPVPVMPLVEVIRGCATSEATASYVLELGARLGKTCLMANDFPGFVSNRILMPMLNEAMFALYEGVATREAIDGIMKLGMNHPMGPLTLADFIGLDVCLAILDVLYEGFGDPKYRACPLLRQYVAAGWLGRKTGRGFYEY